MEAVRPANFVDDRMAGVNESVALKVARFSATF
jgi:hypothetical protein